MIRAEGLRADAGGRWILQSATLTVEAGQVVIVTGPNGSGKSLLARALMGLAPASGKVTVNGVPVKSARGRRMVGYLPQGASLYDYLTVAENLQFFSAMAGVVWRSRAKVVADLLELVGLKSLAEAEAARLSPGQRQRLAFARALAGDPPALVLDEPLAGLDAEGRAELRDLLGTLAQMGKAMLILTGDPDGIAHDRMLFLEHGRLLGGVLA
jgi:ABC-2 type transport system ATP-binding protein